jgi:hypothetical protein
MRRFIPVVLGALALVFTGAAAAALAPGTFEDPAGVCPGVSATFSGGVLHLAKPCTTPTNAAAYAKITDAAGSFSSASFTLASATQCQGGSPRFNVNVGTTTYFMGCNNVTPTINADGSATYVFTRASLAAAGLPVPTGDITSASVLIDVQGSADVSKITFNGQSEVPAVPVTGPTSKNACKHGGWKTFTQPHFRNQGQCVAWVATHGRHGGK